MPERIPLQRDNRSEVSLSDPFARRVPYAMAYVRTQEWETPFAATEALARGTAFSSLVKPFRAMEAAQ